MEVNIEKLTVNTFLFRKYDYDRSIKYIYYTIRNTKPSWKKPDRNKVSIMYRMTENNKILDRLLKTKDKIYISDLIAMINAYLKLKITFEDVVFFETDNVDRYNTGVIYKANEPIAYASDGICHRFRECYFILRKDMIPVAMTKAEQRDHDAAKEKANNLKSKETFIREFLSPSLEQIARKYNGFYNSNLCAIKLFGNVREISPNNRLCISTLIKKSIGKDLEEIGITIPENYNFFDRYDRFISYINLLQCDINLE